MRTPYFWLLLIFLSTFACSNNANLNADFLSLVAAEQSFAKTSELQGMRDAFLTYFADEAIVFRPRPIPGKHLYENAPNVPGMLTWRPIFADISLSGDIGYTTGPWEYRKQGTEEKPLGHGHYISIWKKQQQHIWRVIVDVGIQYQGPDTTLVEMEFHRQRFPSKQSHQPIPIDIEKEQQVLFDTDLIFSDLSDTAGFINAYLDYATDDIRFYRSGYFPVTGKQAMQTLLSKLSDTMTWEPTIAVVSAAGDFGYTYGIGELKSDSSEEDHTSVAFSYLRIWKKQPDGNWKLALDVANEIPPATN